MDQPQGPAAPENGAPPGDDGRRVAEVLERVRAGARQRRAELATVSPGREEARLRLLLLKRSEYLQEPVPASPRPLLGPLLVFARKLVYHLFFKWHARSVLQQQSEFNQAASFLIQDLLESHQRLGRRLERIEERLAALEEPAAAGSGREGPDAGGGTS